MASSVVDRRAAESPVDRYKLLFRLQLLALIGCMLVVMYSLRFWVSGEALRIIGTGILVAGAALMSGFLLGFIFGIPRVGADKVSAKAAAEPGGAHLAASEAQSNAVTANSNLVEISDWLTKIIVGVGLVELKTIPHKLGTLSYYLGLGLRPSQCDGKLCADLISSGQTAGLAIMLFYFTLGFLWGYVWTRLYFQRDLGGVVENLQRDKRVTDLIMSAEQSVNEGQLEEALRSVNEALADNPLDGRAVLTKGRVLKRMAEKSPKAEADKLLYQALADADRAIAMLPGKAEPIYNKACYQALLGIERNETLANLRKAFGLNPLLWKIASEDKDLDSLRQDVDFIKLMESSRTPDA